MVRWQVCLLVDAWHAVGCRDDAPVRANRLRDRRPARHSRHRTATDDDGGMVDDSTPDDGPTELDQQLMDISELLTTALERRDLHAAAQQSLRLAALFRSAQDLGSAAGEIVLQSALVGAADQATERSQAYRQQDTETQITPGSAVRLKIVAGPQFDDPDRWEAQLMLLRKAGATFDGHGAWFLWLTDTVLSTDQTAPLWEAVATYGAHVLLDGLRVHP